MPQIDTTLAFSEVPLFFLGTLTQRMPKDLVPAHMWMGDLAN